MNTVMTFLAPLVIVAMLMLPLMNIYKKRTTGKRMKCAMGLNLASFFAVCLLAVVFPLGGLVSAEGAVAAAVSEAAGMAFLSASIATGLSTVGAGVAVAAAAPAAIGAFSEDPKAFGKALIFVALGEGIALYGLLISILILNKI